MKTIREIEMQRDRVIKELLAVRSLRKGCVNEQWFPVVRDGEKTEQVRGPYYVLSYKVGGKTVSERVKGDAALKQARADVDNYRRFKSLCSELEELTRQLGEVERARDEKVETAKKKRKSRSSRAGK